MEKIKRRKRRYEIGERLREKQVKIKLGLSNGSLRPQRIDLYFQGFAWNM